MQSPTAQSALRTAMLLGLLAYFAGCGQKGALYLPEVEQTVPEVSGATSSSADAQSERAAPTSPVSADEDDDAPEAKDKEPPAP